VILNRESESRHQGIDAPVFYEIEQAVAERMIDGVVIATPPSTHLKLASACLNLGIPVLVEKPFTANYLEAVALNEISKKKNIFCMAGHQHLHSKGYQTLKEGLARIEKGGFVYSEGIGSGPFRKDVTVFRDWGSHEFAIALDLFNETPCSYIIRRIAGNDNDTSRATYLMKLNFSAGGIYCAVFGNTSDVKRRTLTLTHEGGWRHINGLDQGGCVVIEDRDLPKPESVLSADTLPVDLMLKSFIMHAERKVYTRKFLDVAIETARLIDEIEPKL